MIGNNLSNDAVAQAIRSNVKAELDRRGWSSRELARRTGDAHTTIAGTLDGSRVSRIAVVARMAAVLGTTIDALLRPTAGKRRRRAG